MRVTSFSAEPMKEAMLRASSARMASRGSGFGHYRFSAWFFADTALLLNQNTCRRELYKRNEQPEK